MELGKQMSCSHFMSNAHEAAIFLPVHTEVQVSGIHSVSHERMPVEDYFGRQPDTVYRTALLTRVTFGW